MNPVLMVLLSILAGIVMFGIGALVCYKVGFLLKSNGDDRIVIFGKGLITIVLTGMVLLICYLLGDAVLTHYIL